jgi:hypothetical protein
VSTLEDGQVSLSRSMPNDSREYRIWMGGDEATALREFFAAHPETKPWESAKPGEVWRLTAEGTEREYATIMGRATFPHPVDHLYFMPTTDVNAPKLGAKATVISAGRRIWPEVSE